MKSAVLEFIYREGLIDLDDMEKVRKIQEGNDLSLASILVKNGILNEKQISDYINRNLGMNPRKAYSEWTYDIAGINRPKLGVSGDFFTFYPLDECAMGVALCDVMGKGADAGLLAILIAHSLRIAVRSQNIQPSVIVRNMNAASLDFFSDEQFAAFSMLVLDLYRGTLDFCCAGSPPVLVYRKKKDSVEELEVKGIPIGIYSDQIYSTGYTSIDRGDVILLYSDGALEAEDSGGELFGVERLKKSLLNYNKKNSEKMLRAIKRDIIYHSFPKRPGDDITLVVMKRTGRKI